MNQEPECDECVVKRVGECPISVFPHGAILVLQGGEDDGGDGKEGKEEEEEEEKALGGNNDCLGLILQGNNCLRHMAAKRTSLAKALTKLGLERAHLLLREKADKIILMAIHYT